MDALVTVSLGSNIDADQNIRRAVLELRSIFGALTISPVYQTEAVGVDGEDFLNLVVSFNSSLSVQTVALELKSIEDRIGRTRSQPRFSARLIDLDLLTYGDLILDEPGVQVPRREILLNAFVLKPLSDIHGNLAHPECNVTYTQLWREMKQHADRIDPYQLDL